PRSNRRIQTVDTHIGVATAGLLADGRHIINRARDEAENYRNRVGQYAQAYTLYSNVRPFGSSAIIGTVDKEGPQLFMVEPSGVYW
ncbi:2043_t:CDS:2, partial [Racocetra persica]